MKERVNEIVTECSRLVSVMKRRKRSHPEETDVTLLSVWVSDSIASFNFARNPAKVSTEIKDKIKAFPDTAIYSQNTEFDPL